MNSQSRAKNRADDSSLMTVWTQDFEQAAAAARLGMWSCTLHDDALSWTGQVYDMFGLPRGSALRRAETLTFYAARSLRTLIDRRSRAIATGSGFAMDAAITTPRKENRWIRITASVEHRPGEGAVRLFGMKQDITREKLLYDGARYRADFDVVTGLANRHAFETRFAAIGRHDAEEPVDALLLIDLDRFKIVNDTFGHSVGDACLSEAAKRIRGACREEDFVARIGGDEFAVLLRRPRDQRQIARVAARIGARFAAPMVLGDCVVSVGASVGVARASGEAPPDLFAAADAALYAAKAAGRTKMRIDPAPPRNAPER